LDFKLMVGDDKLRLAVWLSPRVPEFLETSTMERFLIASAQNFAVAVLNLRGHENPAKWQRLAAEKTFGGFHRSRPSASSRRRRGVFRTSIPSQGRREVVDRTGRIPGTCATVARSFPRAD